MPLVHRAGLVRGFVLSRLQDGAEVITDVRCTRCEACFTLATMRKHLNCCPACWKRYGPARVLLVCDDGPDSLVYKLVALDDINIGEAVVLLESM